MLIAVNVSVPAPILVSEPGPASTPLKVVVALLLPTVKAMELLRLLFKFIVLPPLSPPSVKAADATELSKNSVPALSVSVLFCRERPFARSRLPAVTVVGPEKVLAAESVTVLAPAVVMPYPEPPSLSTPASTMLPLAAEII